MRSRVDHDPGQMAGRSVQSAKVGAGATLCYVNADIILFDDFAQAVSRVTQWSDRFLMVGRAERSAVKRFLYSNKACLRIGYGASLDVTWQQRDGTICRASSSNDALIRGQTRSGTCRLTDCVVADAGHLGPCCAGVLNVSWVPPLKSIPGLSPRVPSATVPSASTIPDSANHQ